MKPLSILALVVLVVLFGAYIFTQATKIVPHARPALVEVVDAS